MAGILNWKQIAILQKRLARAALALKQLKSSCMALGVSDGAKPTRRKPKRKYVRRAPRAPGQCDARSKVTAALGDIG